MTWLSKHMSPRSRRWIMVGVALMVIGLLPWISLRHHAYLRFYTAWGCYVAGFVLIWTGIFLSKRDLRGAGPPRN
jgi:hypothetical protein